MKVSDFGSIELKETSRFEDIFKAFSYLTLFLVLIMTISIIVGLSVALSVVILRYCWSVILWMIIVPIIVILIIVS